jgi:hypothetical protein
MRSPPPPGLQQFNLARPVWINLANLFPSDRPPPKTPADDHVGLDGEVPGKLHGWRRGHWGKWLGVVSYDIHTVAGEVVSFHRQLLPREVIRPRSYGAHVTERPLSQ